MRGWIMLLLLLGTGSVFCAAHPANDLVDSDSPYLRQHAYNPVRWMRWGDEALARAKKEKKMIFLSIGYSTCHWCHVMARESFEDEQIAALINRYFVSVKVDRERLPHLDSKYQTLHLLMNGRSGGWPLTAFLTEEGKPFFVATYIPERAKYNLEGLDTLLPRIAKQYAASPEKIKRQAEAIERLEKKATLSELTPVAIPLSITVRVYEALKAQYDPLYHGFSIRPKFPESAKLALLFDLDALGTPGALEMALEVLQTMALSGLYDQVEGGFFRYATDAQWQIPHFEKMLYTNAELIALYARAYQKQPDPLFREIVEESIAMVETRFAAQGLYYSASDADSDHEEGGYFVYSGDELKEAFQRLSPEAKSELAPVLGLDNPPNFEGKWHITLHGGKRVKSLAALKKELRTLRKRRTYPFIDTKINAAWNAMMIEALFTASAIDNRYAELAKKRLDALLGALYVKGVLYHQRLLEREPRQPALLEDYAFLTSALIAGYEQNFDPGYLLLAKRFSLEAQRKFYKAGRWYLSDDGLDVVADMQDRYYTAAKNKMLQALLHLSAIDADRELHALVERSVRRDSAILDAAPATYPSAMTLQLQLQKGYVTLKASSEMLLQAKDRIRKIRYPFLALKADEKIKGYLACDLNQCFAMGTDIGSVIKHIEAR